MARVLAEGVTLLNAVARGNATLHEWVDLSSLPELECAICLDVVHDPVNLVVCGHLFCKACLADTQTGCPTCRARPLPPSNQRQVNKFARVLIERLPLACPGPGCKWVGMLGPAGRTFEKHRAECTKILLTCRECKQAVPGGEDTQTRALHLHQCKNRTFWCALCAATIKSDDFSPHLHVFHRMAQAQIDRVVTTQVSDANLCHALDEADVAGEALDVVVVYQSVSLRSWSFLVHKMPLDNITDVLQWTVNRAVEWGRPSSNSSAFVFQMYKHAEHSLPRVRRMNARTLLQDVNRRTQLIFQEQPDDVIQLCSIPLDLGVRDVRVLWLVLGYADNDAEKHEQKCAWKCSNGAFALVLHANDTYQSLRARACAQRFPSLPVENHSRIRIGTINSACEWQSIESIDPDKFQALMRHGNSFGVHIDGVKGLVK